MSAAIQDSERKSRLRDGLPALPDESRIDLAETTDERLVLHIRPGNRRTTRMGRHVLASIIFVCFVSRPEVLGLFQRGQVADLSRVKFYLYFWGLWVIVVWGLAYWVRLQFEHTTLLIERDRIVVERTLFGWTRIEEATFATAPWALVLDSFRGKFFPNELVGIVGQNVRVTFGRMLTDTEKVWLVTRINRFFHAGDP